MYKPIESALRFPLPALSRPDGFSFSIRAVDRELDALEEVSRSTGRPETSDALASLRASASRLIALLTDLIGFRALSADGLRVAVAGVGPLRDECVRFIQQLEVLFQTAQPFYQSRDAHLTESVTAFVANLQQAFADEWATSAGQKG